MKNSTTNLIFLMTLLVACSDGKKEEGQPLESSIYEKNFNEGTRQVHLDFHTSEHIDSVGFAFDKKQFQEALKTGNVNAINIFAKGHHGWSYYPTKIGKMHPTLDFDLMKAQIEACREIGVKVKLYFTVGWSANDATEHPEWIYLDKKGTNEHYERIKGKGPDDHFNGWFYLAPEGEYAELIYEQTEEILENYVVDGIWFDIVTPYRINYNANARKDFKARGIDVNDDDAVYERHIEKYAEFLEKASGLVKKHQPEASVYFNGTTANFNSYMLAQFRHDLYRFNTKNDMEDLPTAWGGYDLFPWRSKYFANIGKDIVAMSGKFHKAWGEFGGFKHKDALLYEVASMVAFGANVNIGDQLHPSGIMEMATYENIGYAFDYVEKIENYGIGATHIATVGLYVGGDLGALEGATMMLLENQVNFNVVNTLEDWSDIEVLVITSDGVLDRDIPKITQFVEDGGKVIAIGEGIIKENKPVIDIGADFLGKATYDIDYTLVSDALGGDLVQSPFLNYRAAIRVKPQANTEVLAAIREPYFSRTLSHYSSHANTPYRLSNADHPAVIKKGNVVFIAHDIDKQYREEGARIHRELFHNALNLLRTKSFVKTEMQSMGRINLMYQPENNRYVVHLLYASPIQKGSVKVIEDLVPLYNIPISVQFPQKIKRAYLIPSEEVLDFSPVDGRLHLIVPKLVCHTAIVFEY